MNMKVSVEDPDRRNVAMAGPGHKKTGTPSDPEKRSPDNQLPIHFLGSCQERVLFPENRFFRFVFHDEFEGNKIEQNGAHQNKHETNIPVFVKDQKSANFLLAICVQGCLIRWS